MAKEKAPEKPKKKKEIKKFNDGCIKLFQFIQMLYEGEVEFKTVIDHFSDGKYDGTSNTHVTLNKYRMLSSLYKIKFTLEDLKSIALLKESSEIMPNGKTKDSIDKLIRSLEIRYDEGAQSLAKIEDTTQNLHLGFAQSEMVEQIKKCEQYCHDNQKLEIIFTTDKGEEINLLCSPLEQIYQKRKVGLKVLGNNGTRIYDIPFENIQSVKQLPLSASAQSIPTTVVYKIKNRLAQNYKIREWERCEKIEYDGSHIIVNKNEDLNLLVKRLMRYGRECEIISPKFLKEEMIERINETLSNYS